MFIVHIYIYPTGYLLEHVCGKNCWSSTQYFYWDLNAPAKFFLCYALTQD